MEIPKSFTVIGECPYCASGKGIVSLDELRSGIVYNPDGFPNEQCEHLVYFDWKITYNKRCPAGGPIQFGSVIVGNDFIHQCFEDNCSSGFLARNGPQKYLREFVVLAAFGPSHSHLQMKFNPQAEFSILGYDVADKEPSNLHKKPIEYRHGLVCNCVFTIDANAFALCVEADTKSKTYKSALRRKKTK